VALEERITSPIVIGAGGTLGEHVVAPERHGDVAHAGDRLVVAVDAVEDHRVEARHRATMQVRRPVTPRPCITWAW
jgi:hypothetical protein